MTVQLNILFSLAVAVMVGFLIRDAWKAEKEKRRDNKLPEPFVKHWASGKPPRR